MLGWHAVSTCGQASNEVRVARRNCTALCCLLARHRRGPGSKPAGARYVAAPGSRPCGGASASPPGHASSPASRRARALWKTVGPPRSGGMPSRGLPVRSAWNWRRAARPSGVLSPAGLSPQYWTTREASERFTPAPCGSSEFQITLHRATQLRRSDRSITRQRERVGGLGAYTSPALPGTGTGPMASRSSSDQGFWPSTSAGMLSSQLSILLWKPGTQVCAASPV